VVAIDIRTMKDLPGVLFIRGDARKPEVMEKAREALALSGRKSLDVVVSDMSPNISGNYGMDQARSVELCEAALAVSHELLRTGGKLVMKVFEGDLFKELVETVKARFSYVRIHGPKASRASSSEIYIVAKGYHRVRKPEVDEPSE